MKKIFISLGLAALLFACHKNPVTGRKQLLFMPESQMIGMSATQYSSFLGENSAKVLPNTDPRAQRVLNVGKKVQAAVESYLTEIGAADRMEGFTWDYNTVDDPTLNAWCMPGGKIVFYTGILKLMDTDDELAVVMGHEIAHAIARHGNERMSQQMALQGVTVASAVVFASENPTQTSNLFTQAVGLGGPLGILAFSRKNESESDEMGLIFMHKAGYDPNAAITFWEKMAAMGGQKPPEILSTHPSNERRIQDLKKIIAHL